MNLGWRYVPGSYKNLGQYTKSPDPLATNHARIGISKQAQDDVPSVLAWVEGFGTCQALTLIMQQFVSRGGLEICDATIGV